jgi:aminopeptidase N
MLRSMMRGNDDHDQDKDFIDMMHDFVGTHRDRAATTESFKTIAEKHMTKLMDFGKNGRLDWFFDEWVYGTQVPRYHFESQSMPADNGKVKLHMTITQSDVDEHFAMLIPVFADFGKGMIRLGQVGMVGNSTRSIDMTVPIQQKKVALNAYKEILER